MSIVSRDSQVLRLVVASPGDVAKERRLVSRVVDEVNRVTAEELGLIVKAILWETDAYPGFHVEGPQGLIDEVLGLDSCDLLVGIFWKRFGTPTTDAESGTEHEIMRAYKSWKEHKRPGIMLYFSRKPYSPQTEKELEQWSKVLTLRKSLPFESLWWGYKDPRDFESLFRFHLSRYLFAYAKAKERAAVSDNITGRIIDSRGELMRRNIEIVQEARQVLFVTGSRSRDDTYLQSIEERIVSVPTLLHFRVLFGPPVSDLFKDHLRRLVNLRNGDDTGGNGIHVGLFDNFVRQPEVLLVGNERRVLVVLPSFHGIGNYSTAILFEHDSSVAAFGDFVKALYVASQKLGTAADVDALEVLRQGTPAR